MHYPLHSADLNNCYIIVFVDDVCTFFNHTEVYSIQKMYTHYKPASIYDEFKRFTTFTLILNYTPGPCNLINELSV